ncbi:MAG TPA: CapA family protein [Gemmatimonadaceae bacterium]
MTLFLCGDVMTGRGVDQVLPFPSDPRLEEPVATSALTYLTLAERVSGKIPRAVLPSYVWGDALEALEARAIDARIVNLETAVTRSEDAEPKGINYRMHPRNVGVLGAARIDCCVLANNHGLDWGAAGLVETLDTLEGAGIRVAGAGRDLWDAQAPALLTTAGATRLLVFAFGLPSSGITNAWAATSTSAGVHFLPDLSAASVDLVASLVRQAKAEGDIAIASVHWGGNWGYGIPRAHERFAHALVDRAGIDIVHGHSSHHPLGIEVHGGRLILYGCGDFLNDYEGISGHEDYRADLVLMYLPVLDAATGRLEALTILPFRIHHFRLNRPADEEREWLRARMERECRRFGLQVSERGGEFVVA